MVITMTHLQEISQIIKEQIGLTPIQVSDPSEHEFGTANFVLMLMMSDDVPEDDEHYDTDAFELVYIFLEDVDTPDSIIESAESYKKAAKQMYTPYGYVFTDRWKITVADASKFSVDDDVTTDTMTAGIVYHVDEDNELVYVRSAIGIPANGESLSNGAESSPIATEPVFVEYPVRIDVRQVQKGLNGWVLRIIGWWDN